MVPNGKISNYYNSYYNLINTYLKSLLRVQRARKLINKWWTIR